MLNKRMYGLGNSVLENELFYSHLPFTTSNALEETATAT